MVKSRGRDSWTEISGATDTARRERTSAQKTTGLLRGADRVDGDLGDRERHASP